VDAIFEFIFEENAGKPGSPLDRSGTVVPGQPRQTQSFFPEIYFPALSQSKR
jgi:hypothetical protein